MEKASRSIYIYDLSSNYCSSLIRYYLYTQTRLLAIPQGLYFLIFESLVALFSVPRISSSQLLLNDILPMKNLYELTQTKLSKIRTLYSMITVMREKTTLNDFITLMKAITKTDEACLLLLQRAERGEVQHVAYICKFIWLTYLLQLSYQEITEKGRKGEENGIK